MSSVTSVSFWAAHLMRRRRRFRLPADLTSPSMPSCMSLYFAQLHVTILLSCMSLYFAQLLVTVFCSAICHCILPSSMSLYFGLVQLFKNIRRSLTPSRVSFQASSILLFSKHRILARLLNVFSLPSFTHK